MYWDYMELWDGTCIAYADINDDGTIPIVIERPVDYDFDSARCLIPAYRWIESKGFTEDELDMLMDILRNNAPLIYEFAEQGHPERIEA